MDVKPNYCSLETVFSEMSVYKVPKYQRAYSWKRENVSQYANDLLHVYQQRTEEDVDSEHFFGGVVCVRLKNDDPLDELSNYQLVDGQQRLSTTVLLVSRIVKTIYSLDGDDEFRSICNRRAGKYKSKFIEVVTEKNNKEVGCPKLEMTVRDRDYYDQHVRLHVEVEAESPSHQLILDASKYFDNWISKNFRGSNNDEYLKNLDVLYKIILKSCKFLLIKMSDVSDAYRLFQVINDRGQSLAAGDLLRASSLGQVDIGGASSVVLEELESIWDDITSGKPSDVETLLQNYLISETGASQPKTKLVDRFSDRFFKDSDDIELGIRNLKKGIDMLRVLSNGEWPYGNTKLGGEFKHRLYFLVVRLGHTHSLPFLLAATKLKEKKFCELLYWLEKFFFIYVVALGRRVGPLSTLYRKNIKRINEDFSDDSYQPREFVDGLVKVLNSVSEHDVYKYLSSVKYDDSDKRAVQILLSALEENSKWLKSEQGLGLKDMYKMHKSEATYRGGTYSIEHIYSQSEMGNASVEVIHSLGNLTILTEKDNSALGNADFEVKRAVYSESNVSITRDIPKEFTSWGEHEVQKRLNTLQVDLARVFLFGREVEEPPQL